MPALLLLSLSLLLPSLGSAVGAADQTTAPGGVQGEIDAQVWIPMLAASNRFDAEGFLAVLSPDLVRVAVDRNEIHGLDRYAPDIRTGFERARQRGIVRATEVRFQTRAHAGDLARDTGIFRSEVVLASGELRVTYTAFEMILRKEGPLWKILVDQDRALVAELGKAQYSKATPPVRGPTATVTQPEVRPE